HASAHANGPLSGIPIPDLKRVLAGPFCTQILADYGAKVLKVEDPKGGDDTRLWRTAAEKDIWKPTGKDMSVYFCAINRNKMSITLDLKQEKGREILFDLSKIPTWCQVENFVPGKMVKMGIGCEKLREINPLIIHAGVSGYGASGPYSHRAGYDTIVAVEAGMLHITGEHDGPPTRLGLGLTDMSTGLYMHGHLVLGATNNRHSRVQNRAELKEILEPIMSAKATEVWLAVLEGSGLPYTPVNTIEEVFSHPQTAARDMCQGRSEYWAYSPSGPNSAYTDTGNHSGTPVKFSETKPQLRRSPPSLGEHTNSTFKGMGFSPKEIGAMREQGIL
ncbi:hypothetical protein N7449_005691, partial [Penicillium cf. viridicatum]